MKKYLIASTPILIGVLCLVMKGIIGDEFLPDGTIVEKNFFLIPLSYIFFFSGIVALLFVAMVSVLKKVTIAK
ncbi:DUF3955 domain-containing protein [Lysinibacillus sp. NPDC097287]|uniref:DUF3955 domain-containing protein n=1 Tax=Lysinibacillus sp. NPDC097287 TaxID=3364144 RepID=UPI00381DF8C2